MRFPKDARAEIHKASPGAVAVDWPAAVEMAELEARIEAAHDGERERLEKQLKAITPVPGKVFWMQSAETLETAEEGRRQQREAAKERAKAEGRKRVPPLTPPVTCADVMADMQDKPRPKRRRRGGPRLNAPRKGDPRIRVEGLETDDEGVLKALVRLVADPVDTVQMRAKVRGSNATNALSTIATLRFDKDDEDDLYGADEVADEYYQPPETEPEGMPPERTPTERAEEEDALKERHRESVERAQAIRREEDVRRKYLKSKGGRLTEEAAERARRRNQLAEEGKLTPDEHRRIDDVV